MDIRKKIRADTAKNKAKVGLAYLMQIAIFTILVFSVSEKRYSVALVTGISLIVTLIPLIIKRKYNITLPWSLNFLILLSLLLYVSGLYSGWFKLEYYFFDKIAHFLGSLTVALLGFTFVLIIDKFTDVELTNKSIIFFVITFSLAVGALWEISEFTLDAILGTTSQYDGLSGTMYDLIFDLLGGIVAGFIAYFKLKKGKEKSIDQLLRVMKLRRIK